MSALFAKAVCEQAKPFASNELLREINCPALIIGNDDDPLHPYDMAQTIHQYLTNSKLSKVVSRYLDDQAHREIVHQITTKFISDL